MSGLDDLGSPAWTVEWIGRAYQSGATTEQIAEWVGASTLAVEIVLGIRENPKVRRPKNSSRYVSLSAFGESKPLSCWAKDPRCSVTYQTISYRLRHGWTIETAISAPRTRTAYTNSRLCVECNTEVYKRGLCLKHFNVWRRSNRPSRSFNPIRHNYVPPFTYSQTCIECGIKSYKHGLCREHFNIWNRGSGRPYRRGNQLERRREQRLKRQLLAAQKNHFLLQTEPLFGQCLRDHRHQSGLSQLAVSLRTGIRPASLGAWEQGICLPAVSSLQYLPKLAFVLDVSWVELKKAYCRTIPYMVATPMTPPGFRMAIAPYNRMYWKLREREAYHRLKKENPEAYQRELERCRVRQRQLYAERHPVRSPRPWTNPKRSNPFRERIKNAERNYWWSHKGTRDIVQVDYWKICIRDGWICYFCQKAIEPSRVAPDPQYGRVATVVPLCLGGTHTEGNLHLIHEKCRRIRLRELGLPLKCP